MQRTAERSLNGLAVIGLIILIGLTLNLSFARIAEFGLRIGLDAPRARVLAGIVDAALVIFELAAFSATLAGHVKFLWHILPIAVTLAITATFNTWEPEGATALARAEFIAHVVPPLAMFVCVGSVLKMVERWLEGVNTAENDRFTTLQTEVATLQRAKDELEAHQQHLIESHETAQQTIEAWTQKYATLTTVHEQLQQTHLQATVEAEERPLLQQQVEMLLTEREKLQQEHDELQQERDKLQQVLTRVQQASEQLQQTARQHEEMLGDVQQERDVLEQQVQKLTAERQTWEATQAQMQVWKTEHAHAETAMGGWQSISERGQQFILKVLTGEMTQTAFAEQYDLPRATVSHTYKVFHDKK